MKKEQQCFCNAKGQTKTFCNTKGTNKSFCNAQQKKDICNSRMTQRGGPLEDPTLVNRILGPLYNPESDPQQFAFSKIVPTKMAGVRDTATF